LLFYFLFSGKKATKQRGNSPGRFPSWVGVNKKEVLLFAFAIIGLLLIDQII